MSLIGVGVDSVGSKVVVGIIVECVDITGVKISVAGAQDETNASSRTVNVFWIFMLLG